MTLRLFVFVNFFTAFVSPSYAQGTRDTQNGVEVDQIKSGGISELGVVTEDLIQNIPESQFLDIFSQFTDVFSLYASPFAAFIVFVIVAFAAFIGKGRGDIERSLVEANQQFRESIVRRFESFQENIFKEVSDFKDALPLIVEKIARSNGDDMSPEIKDMREAYNQYKDQIEK